MHILRVCQNHFKITTIPTLWGSPTLQKQLSPITGYAKTARTQFIDRLMFT